MPLKPRPLDRDGGVVRDASLVIIASEDRYAVKQYFDRFRPRRVQFRVLETLDGRSSPEDVLDRLKDFEKEFDVGPDDEFWLCLDVDHWADAGHIHNLTRVQQECKANSYQIVLSKPCFELWLLLHFQAVPEDATHTCKSVNDELRRLNSGFHKTKVSSLIFTPDQVLEAIDRAKRLPGDFSAIPEELATQVHRILQRLLEKESIKLEPSPCDKLGKSSS